MNLREKIRVVIAEDEPLICAGLAAKIQEIDSDFLVAAEAENGRLALEQIDALRPQVVFTDIKMPIMDGMELVAQLRLRHPSVKIVILSGYSDFAYTQQAIRHGVAGYLLKPVDDEALRDVLAELKSELIIAQYQQNCTTIYSAGYRAEAEQGGHTLFLLCLGNLCADPADAYLREYYAQQQLNWYRLLTGLLPAGAAWFLSEEEEKNQRLLGVCAPEGAAADGPALAQRLQNLLEALLPETPVNVCTSRQTVSREDIWLYTQRMRGILRQRVIPAKGQCFILERDEGGADDALLGIVRLRVNEQLRAAIQAKNAEQLQRELELIFRFMTDNEVPQQSMQKVILFILRMTEFAGAAAEAQCQTKLLRQLSCAGEPSRLVSDLVRTMMQYAAPDHPAEEHTTLARQLVDYVDKHYLQLDNLEDVTRVFRYNYAYLSRLFRKEAGVPMSRYVLEKRIELSKRVIENNDALSVMQIAEMSGFSDKRYFHRAFKSCTGMTPQDYKKSVVIKG